MDLARHLGVPPSSVSRWVSGTEPRSESVVEIAKFLGVDFAWLMTGAGADLSVVREEETPFRVRKPEEPTLIERMEMLQHGYDETKAELAEANRKLDALMDLLTGRKP
jgi:transcriptional regulator with XRE-family HTH domain